MCRKLILITMLGFLSGCAMFSGAKDNSPKPAQLNNIKPKVKVVDNWSRSTGVGNGNEYLQLQAVVYDNSVFTVDNKGKLTKTDLNSGKEVYSTQLKHHISAGVGVGNKQLYAVSGEGKVLAINPQDGKVLWTQDVESEVLAAPTGAQDVVVIHAANGHIIGLDAKGGKELWTHINDAPSLTLRGSSTPTISGEHVLVGHANGQISIINLKSGVEQWAHTVAIGKGRSDLQRLVDINSKVFVDDNEMYVAGFQGKITAINKQSGQINWQRDMSTYRDLAVDFKAVYVSDSKGTVWALDKKNGYTLWKQPELANRELSAPAVLGNTIFVGDLQGYIHSISTEDGSILGREKIDSKPISSQPIVNNNHVLILSDGGRLASIELGKT